MDAREGSSGDCFCSSQVWSSHAVMLYHNQVDRPMGVPFAHIEEAQMQSTKTPAEDLSLLTIIYFGLLMSFMMHEKSNFVSLLI